MNRNLYMITLWLAWLFSVANARSQSSNTLTLPNLTAEQGKEVTLPFSMDNTDGITALQFTLQVPDGSNVNVNNITLSDRRSDHVVAARQVGQGQYRFMVYSPTNQLLRGRMGKLLSAGLFVPTGFAEGQSYEMKLSDVVLSDTEGKNIVTGYEAGKLTIAKGPDLTVTSVSTTNSQIVPGGQLCVSWKVQNIGGLQTKSGFSERLALVDADGMQISLATTHYETTISSGAEVSRQVDVAVPQEIGLDGAVSLQVQVVPNADCGEYTAAQGNNTARSDKTINVGKRLFLQLPQTRLEEGSVSSLKCLLMRSGDRSMEETFTLGHSSDSRVSMPETLTILSGQSGVVFYVTLTDNDVIDADSVVRISVSAANGYTAVEQSFVIEDNELPTLSVKVSKSEVTEGESFHVTVTTDHAPSAPLAITLSSEKNARFNLPQQLTLAAGKTSVTTDVAVTDDDEPGTTETIAINASANRHNTGETLVMVNDNDVPAIELKLSPSEVSESAGLTAVVATLLRTSHTDNTVTVKLSDDSDGAIYFPSQSVSFSAGETEKQFCIGVIDNATVDGNREVNISAAVYLSSCKCSVATQSAGNVMQKLTIIDDDGPSLKLTTSQATICEGSTAGKLTITRNTATTQPLTVSLASDNDESLTYDHSVTIPAGATSVDVALTVAADDTKGNSRTVVFTATADNYADGKCWVMISDQTLPDAHITAFNLSSTEVDAGEQTEAKITVTNDGAAALPSQTKVNIYNGTTLLATAFTQETIEPGQSTVAIKTFALPSTPGALELHAVVNEDGSIEELLYLNNTSDVVTVSLLPGFTASVTTDKVIYNQGETVTISGSVTGSKAKDVDVEIYVINQGVRQTVTAHSDTQGRFTATYTPYALQAGHFVIGACCPGEELTTEMAAVDIYGLKRTSSSYITCETITGEPYIGEIQLSNLGSLPLSNVSVKVLSAPQNCTAVFSPINEIAADGTATLRYTLTGAAPSDGLDWEEIKAQVNTAQGAKLDLTLYYYCRSAKGQLQASVERINTTMIKGRSRDYSFTISNVGKGATGKISLSLPEATWLKAVTPIEMASLAYGESVTTILRFTPTDDMQLNVPVTGQIAVNCENGNGVVLPFSVDPVSESTGTLVVDVADEYTLYATSGQGVANVNVVIKHPTTGAIVAQGQTNSEGRYSQTLPEGWYAISVMDDNHDSYSNNVLVNPGRETVENVFISFQSIKYSWNVVETEIEDEYKVETNVKYETNVPAPVVEWIFPDSIPYKTHIFNVVATNKGLMPSYNVTLTLPEDNECTKYSFLNQGKFDKLLPQQSAVFTVLLTALTNKDLSYSYAGGTQTSTTYGSSSGSSGDSGSSVGGGIAHLGSSDGSGGSTGGGSSSGDTGGGSGSGDTGSGSDSGSQSSCYIWNETFNTHSEYKDCDRRTGDSVYVHRDGSYTINHKSGYCPSNGGGTGGGGASGPLGTIGGGRPGGIIGGGSTGGGSGYIGGGQGISAEYKNCNPCVDDIIRKLVECGGKWIPIVDCADKINKYKNDFSSTRKGVDAVACTLDMLGVEGAKCLGDGIGCAMDAAEKGYLTPEEMGDCLIGGLLGDCIDIPVIGWIWNAYQCWDIFRQPCKAKDEDKKDASTSRVKSRAASTPSYFEAFYDRTVHIMEEYREFYNIFVEYYGDSIWTNCEREQLVKLREAMNESTYSSVPEMVEALKAYKPDNIAEEQYETYLARWYNTLVIAAGGSVDSDNYVHAENILASCRKIAEAEKLSVSMGSESSQNLFGTEIESLLKNLNYSSNSLCASISLRLSQTMTMTRQAFRGTLTVFNGNETTAMKDVKLTLDVRDADGKVATSKEFQINVESLDEFTGEKQLGNGWTLAAGETGTATILFIPTKYAALDSDKKYSFGGSLSYTDPFTDLDVTRELYPVTLTVKPSPNLDMTYFMQRDIIGDDPLTTDVVESMEPAEFALIINNTGNGDATNVRMVTQQPEIIDNEKGLFIDFELLSSQLNGGEATLALGGDVVTDFGNIPAHTTAYAQWWLTSTLLGHFTEYDVDATHVTSYGNEDLSLLNEVSIHELIHSISVSTVNDNTLVGWLTNDVTDSEDLPDMLYLSDGTTQQVTTANQCFITSRSATEYVLTVNTSEMGWNYGRTNDPTSGRQKLVGVTRQSDGQSISLRNFWQTDRTLRDGRDPLYEDILHFADLFTAGSQTYVLTFEPKPDVTLAVESFSGIPETGKVASTAVTQVKVKFNKPIDATTFTKADLTLNCQGVAVDLTKVSIEKENDSEFSINLYDIAVADGYYVLTVQTAGITDGEGFTGESGKQATWVQYADGKVHLAIKTSPDNGGTVSPSETAYDYGATVTFTATPAEGYNFTAWTLDGETVTTTSDYVHFVDGVATLTANFKLKSFAVTIDCDANAGIVTGAATGIYDYRQALTLMAEPAAGYVFSCWVVNGKKVSTNATFEYTVSEEAVVRAIFVKQNENAEITAEFELQKGWNWLSFNVETDNMAQPAQFFTPIIGQLESVASQTQSLYYDAENGWIGNISEISPMQGYKLLISSPTLFTVQGQKILPSSITLEAKWNWIPYLAYTEMPIQEAFSGLIVDKGDVVKGQDSFAIFDGSAWIGSLTSMCPGQSYQYLSSDVKTFTYPTTMPQTSKMAVHNNVPTANIIAPWNYDMYKYADNMALVAQLYDENGPTTEGRYVIAAFVGDECRGLSVEKDGLHFIAIHGEKVDEPITFRVWDSEHGTICNVCEQTTFMDGIIGSMEQPFKITSTASDINNVGYGSISIYPLPVRERLYVNGVTVGDVRIDIVASNGIICLRQRGLPADNGIDVATLSPGIYVITIQSHRGTYRTKFVKE